MILNKNQTKGIDKGRRHQNNTPAGPVKIGVVLQDFLQKVVEPKTGQYQTISRLWDKIAPENLRQHCKVSGIEGGAVLVQADSPSVLFQLRLDSRQYLLQIQKACPAMRIKRLKFVVGRQTKDGC
jgi:predicted nucleic acid-binding Zn ribbon protein